MELLHPRPQLVGDDPEFRDARDDPVSFRVWLGDSPAGSRVLEEPLPVPDQAPDVKIVIENARAAPPIAIDRRGPPRSA